MLDWLMWLSMPKVNAEWEKPGGDKNNLESRMEFNYRESRAAAYNITFEMNVFKLVKP